jgi:hypothetical protein
MSCCFKFLGELEGFQITTARVERSLCGLLCALAGPYVASPLISFVLTVLSVEFFKQLPGNKEKFGS